MSQKYNIIFYAIIVALAGVLLLPVSAIAQTDGSIFKSMNECLEAKVQGQRCEPVFRIVDDAAMEGAEPNLGAETSQPRSRISKRRLSLRDARKLRRQRRARCVGCDIKQVPPVSVIEQAPPVSIEEPIAPHPSIAILEHQGSDRIDLAPNSEPNLVIVPPEYINGKWSSWDDPYNWKETPFEENESGLRDGFSRKAGWKDVYATMLSERSPRDLGCHKSLMEAGVLDGVSHLDCWCGAPWSGENHMVISCMTLHHPNDCRWQERGTARSRKSTCWREYEEGLKNLGLIP